MDLHWQPKLDALYVNMGLILLLKEVFTEKKNMYNINIYPS